MYIYMYMCIYILYTNMIYRNMIYLYANMIDIYTHMIYIYIDIKIIYIYIYISNHDLQVYMSICKYVYVYICVNV